MKILIIGNGYLGGRCLEAWPDAVMSTVRISATADVANILDEHKPDAVLNAAGVVGKPNVDWCEAHPLPTIIGNTALPIMIAEACAQKGIYLLHIGTGCVYYGYSADGAGSPRLEPGREVGWKESDVPNPLAVYTKAKYAADLALATLPNVGIARIRMPIDDRPHPANLINKLVSYKEVVDVVNSVTFVPDMIKVFRALLEQRAAGIFHTTNPGALRHRDIIAAYEKFVDPTHTNKWITESDLVARGLALKKRSNTILQSPNLERLRIRMRPAAVVLEETMIEYARHIRN